MEKTQYELYLHEKTLQRKGALIMERKTLDRNAKPSLEAIRRIESIKDSAIDYSDIPDSTADELKEIAKLAREKRNVFNIRLKHL